MPNFDNRSASFGNRCWQIPFHYVHYDKDVILLATPFASGLFSWDMVCAEKMWLLRNIADATMAAFTATTGLLLKAGAELCRALAIIILGHIRKL
ncbi:MAG TPA: hypothetical protein VNY05_02615 [Candidatus Acidoferrales bacterium]|nr:hypothetical protein [Candidatus Acidoferrales bacterium]